MKPKQWVRPTKKAITIENVEPEIEELSESVPITKDIVEDERPDKLSKGQKISKAIFIDFDSSKNKQIFSSIVPKESKMGQKIGGSLLFEIAPD